MSVRLEASIRIESDNSARSCSERSSISRSRAFTGDHGGARGLRWDTDASSGSPSFETDARNFPGADADSGSECIFHEDVGMSRHSGIEGSRPGTGRSSAELAGRESVMLWRASWIYFGVFSR